MSADNGIYVLESPLYGVANGERVVTPLCEYRVIEAQAIENIHYYKDGPLCDAEIVRYFGRSVVFYGKALALLHAHGMEEKCEILEYGVSIIRLFVPFPSMTIEEAERILKEEHDRVFEEEKPGMYKKREGVDVYLYVDKR